MLACCGPDAAELEGLPGAECPGLAIGSVLESRHAAARGTPAGLQCRGAVLKQVILGFLLYAQVTAPFVLTAAVLLG